MGDWRFVVIWEFRVRAGMGKRFEKDYGADGIWAQLFQKEGAYVGTELVRDSKLERTYLTLDFWTSREAYEKFRERTREAYKAIDAKCEEMTESEREVGRYERA